QKIVRMLLDECAAGGVEIKTDCGVSSVSRAADFSIATNNGVFESNALVIATGGLSIPKMGASDFAYRVARQFGIPIIQPRPALVPLTFTTDDLVWMKPLSGVSTPVIASCNGASFREAALFTHRGLSGPSILQASSYWREGDALSIDCAPDAPDDFLAARK